MPRSIARLRIASAASSASYMRKRLPQPKVRIETWTPVRPSVRWGSFAAAARPSGGRPGRAATAPRAMPLFPRKSRRETVLFFGMWAPLSTPHPIPSIHRNASELALARPALLHSDVSPHRGGGERPCSFGPAPSSTPGEPDEGQADGRAHLDALAGRAQPAGLGVDAEHHDRVGLLVGRQEVAAGGLDREVPRRAPAGGD